MQDATDLTREVLESRLGGRALRTYPAILSTEAEALAWARQGAPHGALVVAAYQASPRGRSGLSWAGMTEPGHGLGLSVILRPALPEHREGWLYTTGLLAVADALGSAGELAWPDEVRVDGERVAAVGAQSEPEGGHLRWGVVNVMVPAAEPPRTDLLARLVDALEARADQPPERVLADYRARCGTLGTRVRARMLPLGPAAPTVVGTAADLTEDGGLSIRTDDGPRVVVLPQSLGFLEDPGSGPAGPEDR